MRYFTVHGHFYQPPRDNPWLGEVEKQSSARPYHDWNERITAECYRANIPNYSRISFNFGPTLLEWMRRRAPEVYTDILKGDKMSIAERGEGNALAQCYNHIIMPLATERDKLVQVRWGIKDFEFRFGRRPKGMWLPEMAVDMATLRILAQEGIEFTILSPHQIESWRDLKDDKWSPFPENFYPFALQQHLGQSKIGIFVFHRQLGESVSFGDPLNSEASFAKIVHHYLYEIKRGLLHIATDGETFGHHKKKGARTLNLALTTLSKDVLLTNYYAFLKRHPPRKEVRIRENTSWSCPHGLERWKSNCGCTTRGEPSWTQEWRKPFRDAMDWLKEKIDNVFEQVGGTLFRNPWEALLDYIEVVFRGDEETQEGFFSKHAKGVLKEEEKVKALKLMEMERMGQFMFTSCGWFFADISGMEAVQNMKYAARAIDLAKELASIYLEEGYTNRLYLAKSNVPEAGNGLEIYKGMVTPSRFTEADITAHYLMESALNHVFTKRKAFNHHFSPIEIMKESRFGTRLYLGRTEVMHLFTRERGCFAFVVLVYHPRDLHCVMRPCTDEQEFQRLSHDVIGTYRESISELVRLLDRIFGPRFYNLKDLITIV